MIAGNTGSDKCHQTKEANPIASQNLLTKSVHGYLYGYDQDIWEFTADKDDKVVVEMVGTTIPRAERIKMLNPLSRKNAISETIFSVIDPMGEKFVLNHKGAELNADGQKLNPIEFRICNTGVHKIYANTYKNDQGGYRLTILLNNAALAVSPGSKPAAQLDTDAIRLNTESDSINGWKQTQEGTFFIEDKQDTYIFSGNKGQLLKVQLKMVKPFSELGRNDFQPQLFLLDSNNELIESAIDAGVEKDSILFKELPSTGQYSIIARLSGNFALPSESVHGNDGWNEWDLPTNPLFNLGPNGLGHYEIQFNLDSDGMMLRQEFPLENPASIKMNFIRVTDDASFFKKSVTNAQIQTHINHLNQVYGELLPVAIWSGFELASITDYYDSVRYKSLNLQQAYKVMDEVGVSPAARDNAINIIIADINSAGTQGYTFENYAYQANKGAQIVIDQGNMISSIDKYSSSVLVHEMAHVIGVPHFAGFWPPKRLRLTIAEDLKTYDYISFLHSNSEQSYMSSWNSIAGTTDGQFAGQSWYLTRPKSSLATPTFGRVVRAAFVNWLVENEAVKLEDIPSDLLLPKQPFFTTSNSTNWSWDQQAYLDPSGLVLPRSPLIVSSDSPTDQSGAALWMGKNSDEIWLVNRDNKGTWNNPISFKYPNGISAPTITMNSSGNAIALWQRNGVGSNSTLEMAEYNTALKQWQKPVLFSSKTELEESARYPRVGLNKLGMGFAGWIGSTGTGNSKKYQVKIRTRDPQGTWAETEVIHESSNLIAFPSISLNDQGDKWLVWQEFSPTSRTFKTKGKFYSQVAGHWSGIETYSDGNSHAGFAQVSLDNLGEGIMFWREADNSRQVPAHHFIGTTTPSDGYLSMSATAHLKVLNRSLAGQITGRKALTDPGQDSFNTSVETSENVNIRFTSKGGAVATWYGFDGQDYRVYTSLRDDSGSWDSPTALSLPGNHAKSPRISIGDNGEIVILWGRRDPLAGHVIEFAYLDIDSGKWSNPEVLSALQKSSIWGDITFDGDGVYTVMWIEIQEKQKDWDPDIFRLVVRSGKSSIN